MTKVKCVMAEPPPEVAAVFVNGKLNIVGLSRAASYLGLTPTSVRRCIIHPEGNHSAETVERVLDTFPAFREARDKLKTN